MSPLLPKKVTDFAATAVRTSMQFVESAVAYVRAARGGESQPTAERPPAPNRPPVSPRTPRRPRAARTEAPPPAPRAPAPPPPDPSPVDAVPEPTPGQAARVRAEQREAEQTDDSPGPEVHVDEPWPGYASMNAPEIIDRLRVSDDAVKAVVVLYERSHRARKTVLRAAGA
jgi:hypothetical protein